MTARQSFLAFLFAVCLAQGAFLGPVAASLKGVNRRATRMLALLILCFLAQLDIPRLEQLQNTSFTVKLFPRMNHDMLDVDTGAFPATLFPDVFAWSGPRLGGS